MKIIQINSFGNLSTGRIAVDLYKTLVLDGHTGVIAYARNTIPNDIPSIKIGSKSNIYLDGLMTRLTDRAGFYSKKATRKLIRQIREYNPDIIHLHNLHGYYINIEILFAYLKVCGKPVVWTLHDCWAFTGHCCYYSMIGCSKWKTGCRDCPQENAYPTSYTDNSIWNYQKKKELFLSIPNLTLVAVSNWLADEIRQSFLNNLHTVVIQNGIDTNIFKPTQSDFRVKYGLENKLIVLGVASTWDIRKGLNDFVKLSTQIDNGVQIVLMGISSKERRCLPTNILGLPCTNSIEELAEIYTAADIFFNASVEETFGLPTVEAMACGTPIIVYNATSLPEVCDDNVGWVVEQHDLKEVKRVLEYAKTNGKQLLEKGKMCIKKAKSYEKKKQFSKYVSLYKELNSKFK